MSVDQVVNVLVTITLIQLMVAIGLGVTFAEVVHVARNWSLVARAALANYVLAPATTVGLLLLFDSPPLVVAGFLVAAVCPGAPYAPPFTGMAKGNVPISIGLMVILAASSTIVAPLLLQVLLPVTSGEEPPKVATGRMVGTLLLTQLIPLGIGLAVRQCRPELADRLRKPANRLSAILNLAVLGLIVGVDFDLLASVKLIEFEEMLILVIAALVGGWLLGGPGGDKRKAMAFSTGVRNVSVSLVIVTSNFPGTPAVTAVLAYALIQTVVLALLAAGWGRWSGSPPESAGARRATPSAAPPTGR
jgi:bile acid:Na+ symporter, BASS family